MKMKAIMRSSKIFALLVILCVRKVISVPISVPIDNNYVYNDPTYGSNQNYYEDNTSARKPNSYFNRLPPNSFAVQADDTSDTASNNNNDYDYDDQQTDKPVPSNQQQSPNYSNALNNNYLLTQNRVKFKKKRRVRRPCIPIQSFGSSLFSNRLKRELHYDPESGKTLGFLLGGLNDYNYAPYYQSGASQGIYSDNLRPQYDRPQYNRPQYDSLSTGQIQYQPYGGYPCVPISYGHKPGGGLFGGGQSGGPFGNRPSAGNGGGGGPLGFFGQGGLLDFGSANPLSPAGIYQGTGNYPQTVIINRPPLFANAPNFNRPQSSSSSDNTGNANQPGFWGSVVDKLQEFV